MKKITKAVFPVAGLGTRFLPATKAIPKEMLPIIDKPLIEYAVEEAVMAGIEEIIFITSHTKRSIEDHFDKNSELEEKLLKSGKKDAIKKINRDIFQDVSFTYVRQKSQKGLGHAILQAKHFIKDESFAILLADDLIINDPSATRNRYLFEWWVNGVHYIRQDWAIDDNRVVNANEGLKLFTVTLDPLPNQYIQHRTAEIDKITYDYYNMYEKIVRGLVSVTSQTPYNPVSNFGNNTIGNFRAVAFSSAILKC